jgi:cell division septal protein FtsQ
MFFHRKAKNRRLGREYVLDVKLRSSQVRATRMRAVALALCTLVGTVAAGFLLWRTGEWALNRLVYENRAFAIQDVDLQTDGSIAVEQLRRWAGVRPGQNLLALDLARVKQDLERATWVQSASVERILPHTLRIRVLEREALAQINLPHSGTNSGVGTVFHIDAEGWVMLPLEPRQRTAATAQPAGQLPLITGVRPADVQSGRRIDLPEVQAALQWIAAFEQSPMAGLVELRRVDVSAPNTLVVTTGQGSEVTFGLRNLDLQLRRWQEIFDMGQKLNRAIATLDLAVTNNIPARWLEASAVPAGPVRVPKPLPPRKKHV